MRKLFSKFIVSLLVFSSMLSPLLNSVVRAEEVTSQDRRIGAIRTAFQKIAADGANLDTLTADELRIIGIFISNFYVPFSTELGTQTNSEEISKKSKEQMVTILNSHLQYNKEVAEKLVDKLYGISNGAKPLYFASGNKNSEVGVELANDSRGAARPVYFYEFLLQALASDSIYMNQGNNGPKFPFMNFNINSKPFGYLTTQTGSVNDKVSENTIAFDYSPYGGGFSTPSQLILGMIMQNLDRDNSIGTSMFDLTEDEIGKDKQGSEGVILGLLDHLGYKEGFTGTIEKLYKASSFNWVMLVDAFGNILVDTGSRRYVAIPAALNPYVFEGKGVKRGDAIPLNNLQTYTTYRYANNLTYKDGKANVGSLNVDDGFIISENKKALKITKGFNITQWDMTPLGFKTVVLKDDIGEFVRDQLVTQLLVNNYDLMSLVKKENEALHPLLDSYFSNGWLKLGRATGSNHRLREEAYHQYRLTQHKISLGASDKDNKDDGKIYAYDILVQNVGEMFAGDGGVDTFFLPKSNVGAKANVPAISSLVVPDTIGTLAKPDGLNDNTLRTMVISNSYLGDSRFKEMDNAQRNLFKNLTSDRSKLAFLQGSLWGSTYSSMASTIFVTYVMTGMTAGQNVDQIKDRFGFAIANGSNFPSITESLLNSTSDTTDGATSSKGLSDEQRAKLEIWNYEMMNPEEQSGYSGRNFKTKANSFMLQFHRDITGSNESQVGSGATKYTGILSYMSMPSLSDIAFTRNLLSSYQDFSIYLVILVAVVLFMLVILGEITVIKAIINVFAFTILLTVPAFVMQFSADTSNAIANGIYTNKFNYFAIVQDQLYKNTYDETVKSGTEGNAQDYTQGLLSIQSQNNTGMFSGNGTIGASTTVKWMTPKKFGFTDQLQEELEQATGVQSQAFNVLSRAVLRKGLMGESYDQNTNATYLYRSYSDIGNYSRNIYGNLMQDKTYDNTGGISHYTEGYESALNTMGLKGTLNYLTKDLSDENAARFKIDKGFINANKNASGSTVIEHSNFKRLVTPISSSLIANTTKVDMSKIGLNDVVGVNPNAFKIDVNNFNNHRVELISGLRDMGTITSNQAASIGVFALFTESPFYHFSWNLYDNGLGFKASDSGNFKSLMLDNNSGFFYNYKITNGQAGYGAMKDYLDMSGLFNVTIPYLRKANEPVQQFTKAFGAYPYVNIPSDENSASLFTDKQSDNYYKYWFNRNLNRMYNQYTAWVDTMEEADYAKPTRISYAGKTQEIKDPLNPSQYTLRPMVFSESEMLYYGLTKGDLTEVERKILRVQEKTRQDWLQLMNYYTLSDVVLNNAASMLATFNFNREFSQSNMMGNSLELYPQGYELKNFTYDAYLKLIVANSSGESLLDDTTTIYERTFEKAGMFFGILVILNDILAQIVIPVLRWVALLTYFLLSLLVILVCVLRSKEFKFGKVFSRAFVFPFVLFVVVNFLLAFVVSWFIGEGVTSVTGSLQGTISLGSPTLTLFLMFIVHTVACGGFGYLLFLCGKNLFTYGKVAWGMVSGVVMSVAEKFTSGFTGLGGALLSNSETFVENQISNEFVDDLDGVSMADSEDMYRMSEAYDGPTSDFEGGLDYNEVVEQGRANLYEPTYESDVDYDGNTKSDSMYDVSEEYLQAEREAKSSDMEDLLKDDISDLESKY